MVTEWCLRPGYSACASVSAFSPFCWSAVIARTYMILSHWPSVVVVAPFGRVC